jgi:hypothetical protein
MFAFESSSGFVKVLHPRARFRTGHAVCVRHRDIKCLLSAQWQKRRRTVRSTGPANSVAVGYPRGYAASAAG